MALIKGHYVPRFYLRGFKRAGTEHGALFVLDKVRRRRWQSTPAKAALETGMYATESHPDPEVFERTLGRAEGIMATVHARTLAPGVLPTGDDWAELLGMVAVMVVRGPKYRNRVRAMADAFGEVHRRCRVSQDDRRRAFDRMLRDDAVPPGLLTFDDFNAIAADGGIEFMARPSTYLWMMSQDAGRLVPVLGRRQWAIRRCADGAPDLVCSDHPVAVTPVAADRVRPGELLGLDSPGTKVTFPLDRRTMLVGTFGGRREDGLSRADVAAMNLPTIVFGEQIYSLSTDFVWLHEGMACSADDLMAMLGGCDSAEG